MNKMLTDKLVALLEQGAVIIPDYQTMVEVGTALDRADVTYRKAYYAGSFDEPAMYVFRLLDEDPSNAERLRHLLCTPDVPFRQSDRGISSEASALAAIRARSRLEQETRAADPDVQPLPVEMAVLGSFGWLIGCLAAIGLSAYDIIPKGVIPGLTAGAVLSLCGWGLGFGIAVALHFRRK